ncbi:hypothetical protein HYPSUDRAFT_49530 [Hypholoma sublateritium FD-334 SS-4]|uniref:Uncharacterized protein n=1 Tax=Hypholoma sublateritium (strain FD-334 SS-4) TaxID=945553 RepID=A0A0D2KH43_HYPSF|nr:hypothetical protein HYPSUDRAFT_49530 [Hypholoma sublateritium FD-334 SS-4]
MSQPASASRSVAADFTEGRKEIHQQHVYPPAPQKSRAQNIQPARDFPRYQHLINIYYTPSLYAALHAQSPRTRATGTHTPARKAPSPQSAILQHDAIGRQSQRPPTPSNNDTPAHPAPVHSVRDNSDVPFLLALAHLPQRALDLGEALDSAETSVYRDIPNTTGMQEEPEAARPAEGGEDTSVSPTAESAASTFRGDEAKGGWNIAAWKSMNAITEERRGTVEDIVNIEEPSPVHHSSKGDDLNQAEEESFDEDWDHISQFQDD